MNKRPLSQLEQQILNKLLSSPFLGRDEVIEQLKSVTVSSTGDDDNYGSIYLHPDHQKRPAEVSSRVPVEGLTKDSDGEAINVLLHVVDGYVNELEVVRLDGSPMIESTINTDDMEVTVN